MRENIPSNSDNPSESIAVRELWQQWRPGAFREILRDLPERGAAYAEDLMDEIFMKFLIALVLGKVLYSPRGLLWRMTRNAIVDEFRRKRRRSPTLSNFDDQVSVSLSEAEMNRILEACAEMASKPGLTAQDVQEMIAMAKGHASLKARIAEIIVHALLAQDSSMYAEAVKKMLAGKDHSTIAGELGLATGSVRTYIDRFKVKMRGRVRFTDPDAEMDVA